MPKKPILTRFDYARLSSLAEDNFALSVASDLEARSLHQKLQAATIVDDNRLPPHVIALGSFVLTSEVYTGELEEYQLVLPPHGDISHGRLSVLAPLGTALIGQRVGDLVSFRVPVGIRTVRIKRVQTIQLSQRLDSQLTPAVDTVAER